MWSNELSERNSRPTAWRHKAAPIHQSCQLRRRLALVSYAVMLMELCVYLRMDVIIRYYGAHLLLLSLALLLQLFEAHQFVKKRGCYLFIYLYYSFFFIDWTISTGTFVWANKINTLAAMSPLLIIQSHAMWRAAAQRSAGCYCSRAQLR